MHLARLIFLDLESHGYDVFLDVNTIDSGEFDQIILNQIAARAHFVLVLSRGSLVRCANEGDWLRREIEEAFRLNRNIIPVFDEGFSLEADKEHLPEPLRTELPRRNGVPLYHFYFDAGMDTLRTRFLKQPVYNLILTPTPAAEQEEVHRRIAQVALASTHAQPEQTYNASLVDISKFLPTPFEWIPIPGGQVTLEEGGFVPKDGTMYTIPDFAIAKYPITNAQYQLFLDATDGYRLAQWWPNSPMADKSRIDNLKPRKPAFEAEDLPRTNVSWYQAVAFCRWLSGKAGINIILPTEQQWQRAAQGDDNRQYAWGNDAPDMRHCNYGMNVGQPTPVAQYPAGASPYGVMDMCGNVWEWCLNDFDLGFTDVDKDSNYRLMRGGGWGNDNPHDLRAVCRGKNDPGRGSSDRGFRITHLLLNS
jgi:formylglycine-generating enzyme required for sulfatase activity